MKRWSLVIALELLVVTATLAVAGNAATALARTDGQLWELSKLADAWWAKKAIGIDLCERTVPSIEKPPPAAVVGIPKRYLWQVEGFAAIASCAWSLTPWFARWTRSDWEGHKHDLAYECAVAIHEVGHARGLEHGDPRFIIMTDEMIWNEIIPGECWRWATRVRRDRRHAGSQNPSPR